MTIFLGGRTELFGTVHAGTAKQQAAVLLCAAAVTEGTGTLLSQTHLPFLAVHCPRSHHKPWPKSSGFGCMSAGRPFGQWQSPSQAGAGGWHGAGCGWAGLAPAA